VAPGTHAAALGMHRRPQVSDLANSTSIAVLVWPSFPDGPGIVQVRLLAPDRAESSSLVESAARATIEKPRWYGASSGGPLQLVSLVAWISRRGLPMPIRPA
jgi:hypothetical protein